MDTRSQTRRKATQKVGGLKAEAIIVDEKLVEVEDFIACGDCDTHNPPGTANCSACGTEL